jgi:hypothetical protein
MAHANADRALGDQHGALILDLPYPKFIIKITDPRQEALQAIPRGLPLDNLGTSSDLDRRSRLTSQVSSEGRYDHRRSRAKRVHPGH